MNKTLLLLLVIIFQSCVNSSTEKAQGQNDIRENEIVNNEVSLNTIPSLNFSSVSLFASAS